MKSDVTILIRDTEESAGQIRPPKWGSSPLYAAAFGYIPLALAVVFLSLASTGWGIYNIVSVANANFHWDNVGDIITGCFKILIGIIGTFATVVTWANGLHFVLVAYNIFVVSQGVSLLTKWLEWSLAMAGATTDDHIRWVPTGSDWQYMGFFTLSGIALIFISYAWVVGWIKSLRKIIESGGSGWERKNYLTILDEKFAAEELEGIKEYQNKYGEQQKLRSQDTSPPVRPSQHKLIFEMPQTPPDVVIAPPRALRKADPGEPTVSMASTADYEDADASGKAPSRTLSDWI